MRSAGAERIPPVGAGRAAPRLRVPSSFLARRRHATVLTDAGEGPPRLEITASFTYVRIRREEGEAIDAWAERLALLTRRGIDVYAFLKHDRRGLAVDRAMRLSSLLRAGSELGEQALLS